MTLKFNGGLPQIFKHSKEFDQGGGKIRPGQATAVVALDGSGDFDGIQEAINALPSSGGIVYIKEGTYIITSTIAISKNYVSLVGAGKSTHIKTTNSIDMLLATSKTGLHLEKLYFEGRDISVAGNDGIIFDSVTSSDIVDCWIEDFDGNGIRLIDSSDITIRGNFCLSNATGSGILSDAGSSRIIINGNICNDNGNHGIGSYAASSVISNNSCRNNDAAGIGIFSADNTIINANFVEANNTDNSSSLAGIYLSSCEDAIVTNNRCKDNLQHQIRIFASDSRRCIITGNNCTTSTGDNIDDSGTDTVISNNGPIQRCSVYHSSSQTIPTSTETDIVWNSELFDSDSMHSTSINTDRITINQEGYYLISTQVYWFSNSSGYRALKIMSNFETLSWNESSSPGTRRISQNASKVVKLNKGDYIHVKVIQSSGGDLDIYGDTYTSYLEVIQLQ